MKLYDENDILQKDKLLLIIVNSKLKIRKAHVPCSQSRKILWAELFIIAFQRETESSLPFLMFSFPSVNFTIKVTID